MLLVLYCEKSAFYKKDVSWIQPFGLAFRSHKPKSKVKPNTP
jgi:hypothetical protein